MHKIHINTLIEVVTKGGKVRTGVDLFSRNGRLLLQKDILVTDSALLEGIKKYGIRAVPVFSGAGGGIWDQDDQPLSLQSPSPPHQAASLEASRIEERLAEIAALKEEAGRKHQQAKENLKKTVTQIRESGGEFDLGLVEETVRNLAGFLEKNETAFSYLTKEILFYDDYLYNHSINVFTIATVLFKRFNKQFTSPTNGLCRHYQTEEMHDIGLGFFLHDVGKVLLPQKVLNKEGRLTAEEFELVKTHSYEKGALILAKNRLENSFVSDSVLYHHSRLFAREQRCYPTERRPEELPFYVKACKLADIYDAMSAKRSYKEAMNPPEVVAHIFRAYTGQDDSLQKILHSFVKLIGVYPPGSIVFLKNGQLAYILDSIGPLGIIFTDTAAVPLKEKPNPLDLAELATRCEDLAIDRNRPLTYPGQIYDILPSWLK